MKISKLVVIASLLGSLVTTLMAKGFDYDIHLGLSNYESNDGNKGANFNIGYGITKVFDNNTLMGVTVDSEYASIKEKEIYSLSGDFKAGHNFWKKLNVYAIGGYKIQTIDAITGYGFGYGGGIEYLFNDHMMAALEYKTYAMISKHAGDYDVTIVGIKLKYLF